MLVPIRNKTRAPFSSVGIRIDSSVIFDIDCGLQTTQTELIVKNSRGLSDGRGRQEKHRISQGAE